MVTIEETNDSEMQQEDEPLPSEERLLDAAEIEKLAESAQRPTARLHLTALAKKLHREAEALQRMEKTRHLHHTTTKAEEKKEEEKTPTHTAAPVAPPKPVPSSSATASTASLLQYVPVDKFAFDAGGYNAPFVTLYVNLPGVGSIPRDSVTCDFTATSFDLIVRDLGGKNYRLFKDNLEKDIDPEKSKIIVKAEKVIVKLHKVKQGDYGGFEYWSQLTSKKARKSSSKKVDDPQQSIMQLMKDMYDEGDDNMRKVIGETMMKQRTGQLNDDLGAGGLGSLDDGL